MRLHVELCHEYYDAYFSLGENPTREEVVSAAETIVSRSDVGKRKYLRIQVTDDTGMIMDVIRHEIP